MNTDFSFPADRRLSQSSRIQEVLDDGTLYKGQYCHLFCGDRDEDHKTRAAFVVSEKSAKKATFRNRIKRLMRESFRHLLPHLREGWLLVFVATRAVTEDLKRQDFDEDLQIQLTEAGLLEESTIP